ncbi:colicin E3-like toxin immunity protein [Pantoea sp. FN0302]|uniref:colicin E3-like toxin immunity protein n=1 Tax=Pantoea sp. FN0302 TaxID=3418558 RepID=UPI003CF21D65
MRILAVLIPQPVSSLKDRIRQETSKNIYKEFILGLKLELYWCEKNGNNIIGEESSKDLGGNFDIVKSLGFIPNEVINNGEFDVPDNWVEKIQPFFKSPLLLKEYD